MPYIHPKRTNSRVTLCVLPLWARATYKLQRCYSYLRSKMASMRWQLQPVCASEQRNTMLAASEQSQPVPFRAPITGTELWQSSNRQLVSPPMLRSAFAVLVVSCGVANHSAWVLSCYMPAVHCEHEHDTVLGIGLHHRK